MKQRFWVALVFVLLFSLPAAAQPITIFHDPWLNWDFTNRTGQLADDFHIIVESPDWTPPEVFGGLFPYTGAVYGDNNGDGLPDTMLTWSGPPIPPGAPMHAGLYMLGSGRILDAYWTLGGQKVGPSVPITYEKTEIFIPDPVIVDNNEVHMLLQFAPGYCDDPGNTMAVGWTNIRTFANIPAEMLGLADLNEGLTPRLDGDLLVYEVNPREGGPDGDVISRDRIVWGDGIGESFFDVYLATVPDEFRGPQWESLLVADIIMDDGMGGYTTVGWFWNLNPQCPEPGTITLVVFGGLLAVLKLKKRRP
jgi:hypothetical protein